MQSTRLLITAQRFSSNWKTNHLLRRCISVLNSTNINTNSLNLNKYGFEKH